jgi:hypothetical protein
VKNVLVMSGQAQRGQVASRWARWGIAALFHLVLHPVQVMWDASWVVGCWAVGWDMFLQWVVGDCVLFDW